MNTTNAVASLRSRREPQPQLAEVGQGERARAAQRRGHEEQQRQVAGGEPDRVPEHVDAVLEDQPGDAEEATPRTGIRRRSRPRSRSG